MSAVIAGTAIRTCLGDGAETFEALLSGRCGVTGLRHLSPQQLNVAYAYQIPDGEAGEEQWFRASAWLSHCVAEAVRQSGIRVDEQRVVALVGTGLRELRAVERCALEGVAIPLTKLHFGEAVRHACPQVSHVVTVSNACSAGGHVLALAQDLIELGDADVVIVGAADALTASMLAMIGRFAERTAERVQPFDAERRGVLLGEGAAALVLTREEIACKPLGRVLATGMSCDAWHSTMPHPDGIRRAMADAFGRAERDASDVDIVVAHGTGTALNDPVEALVLRERADLKALRPVITAVKGAVGHNSGAAALVSLDVALRCLAAGRIPAIVGLNGPLDEGRDLALLRSTLSQPGMKLAQINAFGFGGVNSITLLEAVA